MEGVGVFFQREKDELSKYCSCLEEGNKIKTRTGLCGFWHSIGQSVFRKELNIWNLRKSIGSVWRSFLC